MILNCKLCFGDLDIETYLFSKSVKLFINYQKELLEPMVTNIKVSKPNIFRHVQNLSQDKEKVVMTPNEYKILTSTCWNEKYRTISLRTNCSICSK